MRLRSRAGARRAIRAAAQSGRPTPSPTPAALSASPDNPTPRPTAAAVKTTLALAVAGALAQPPASALEWGADDALRITYAPAAVHYNASPEHVDFNHLVAIEWLTPRWTFWKADRTLFGLALFDNSFGQFSQYLYAGLEWNLWQLGGGEFYADFTVGLMHGYKGIYQNKIPLNDFGVAPVAVPAIGWRRSGFGVNVMFLGTAGLMIGVNYEFPR